MNTQSTQPTAPSLFWWRWLIVTTVVVLIFSIAMVVMPVPVLRMFSLLYYSSPEGIASFGAPAVAFVMFLQGILGAVMFGWSAALLLVLLGSFRRGSREGWMIMSASLAAWFIPDTTFSLWSGFWQNAVLNFVLLVFFAIPLGATYRTFFQKERSDFEAGRKI